MEKDLKFSSAVCTSRVQSERLLTLGLNKETADMWYPHFARTCPIPLVDETLASDDIPAWSLHRLIILIGNIACDWIFRNDDCYTNAINCIEWLIKEGYFNKEYLNGND